MPTTYPSRCLNYHEPHLIYVQLRYVTLKISFCVLIHFFLFDTNCKIRASRSIKPLVRWGYDKPHKKCKIQQVSFMHNARSDSGCTNKLNPATKLQLREHSFALFPSLRSWFCNNVSSLSSLASDREQPGIRCTRAFIYFFFRRKINLLGPSAVV